MRDDVLYKINEAKTISQIEETLDYLYEEVNGIEHHINVLLDRLGELVDDNT